MCTYMSEEHCELEDKRFKQYSEENRRRLSPLSTSSSTLPPGTAADDFGTSNIELSAVPTTTMKIPVLLIQWSDHEDRTLIPREDIDALFNGEGADPDLHPVGSIANWTNLNSHGKVSLEAVVMDWYKSEFTEAFIADGRSAVPNGEYPDFVDAILPVLEHLDDQGVDWSQFDGDGNFRIDSMIILHTGYSAELNIADCYTGTMKPDRIQSIARSSTEFRSQSGYSMGNFAIASVYRGVCEYRIARQGTMTHEFIHTIGLPDLYDMDGLLNEAGNVGGVGGFDIM